MESHRWWQTTVIYQIYPRSFQDTTGNGVGDLPGITRRMSYLADTLGVGTIWISPFYPSPMADFGYDVADYTDVHPMFGTLDDFDELLAAAHAHSIKVIIDWVPNHSSDQHPWFLESRSSRDNPKRDWYIWRDPKTDGSLPNNWQSAFGGPAWEFDEATGQYYLHTFVAAQPDLNWRKPDLKQAMFDTVRFWLDRGIDGLRIDVAHFIGKDPELRDNPLVADDWERKFKSHGSDYDGQVHLHDKGHPDTHNIFRELRTLLDGYQPDRFAVGEIHIADWQEWASYYGKAGDELHMPYNFSLIHAPWNAESIRSKVAELEDALPEGAWPGYVLGNHDETRLATRVGPAAARVAAMLLFTLRGTPTLYYGDELALPQTEIAPEDQQDPWGRSLPGAGRDGCRTPMQWDGSPHGGFSSPATAATWLPMTLDRRDRNVESQLQDPTSILTLHQALLRYRNSSATLQTGDYHPVDSPAGCYSFERTSGVSRVQVVLNFTDDELQVPGVDSGTVALSTYLDRKGESATSTMTLRPNEGVIVEIR